jgi:hypothetical protein
MSNYFSGIEISKFSQMGVIFLLKICYGNFGVKLEFFFPPVLIFESQYLRNYQCKDAECGYNSKFDKLSKSTRK